jgi:hypothetical protein
MSKSRPYVSQQTLDNLVMKIRLRAVPDDAPNCIATSMAHTLFWELVAKYLELATAEHVVATIAAGAIPISDAHIGSPLGLAAEKHLTHLIKPLIAAGCAINAVGAEDMTPLEHAIANSGPDSSTATVAILLQHGAVGSRSESILNYAAYCGHPHNVEAILNHGIDPNAACPVDDTTALVTALQNLDTGERMAKTVKLLLRRGADPTQPSRNVRYKDAIDLPVDALAEADVRTIDDHDLRDIASLMIADKLSATDLLDACMRSTAGNDSVAYFALESGAIPAGATDTNSAKESTFQNFARKGMARSVAFMLEHFGENPQQVLPNGSTLISEVTDEDTLVVLRARLTQNAIDDAMPSQIRNGTSRSRPRVDFSL